MTGAELLIAKALLGIALNSPTTQPVSPPPSQKPPSKIATVDNFADAMRATLKCYHRTASYKEADIVTSPWPRQDQYGASNSAVVKIVYAGTTGKKYQMTVAVMARKDAIRTHLLEDNALIKANEKCSYENWVKVDTAAK